MRKTKIIKEDQWETRVAVVTDWCDGPREGACALSSPLREFWFQVLDERRTIDGLDERVYSISDLAIGSVDRLSKLLRVLGEPEGKIWCPLWRHDDPKVLDDLREKLDSVRLGSRALDSVVLTKGLLQFRACWDIPKRETVSDWFGFLGV